jgi:hypothetical protein
MKARKKLLFTLLTVAILFSGFAPLIKIVEAAQLTGASVTLSDSRPSQASVSYTFDMDNVSTGSAVMCFTIELNPNADGSGTSLPTGMNISSAGVSTGASDYIPSHSGFAVTTSNNVITYKHATTGQTPASATDRTLIITGITNGSTVETAYYAFFSTWTDTNCTTPAGGIDTVTLTYIFVNGQQVTATVDPTLVFTIAAVNSGTSVNGSNTTVTTTDGTIPFGTLGIGTAAVAAHAASVQTNADGGYTVTVRYTGQLASPGHNFTDHTGTNAAPTTFAAAEAFGYTTTDSTLSGTADRFTSSGGNKYAGFSASTPGEVGYNSGPNSSADTFNIGYKVLATASTPFGAYQTTVVIVATPTY